ncbi:50S ribosomal protein L21 [Paracoccaceae bacterium]|nr:50S ribosomal protein L21 [Paracoccaceae bacterium]
MFAVIETGGKQYKVQKDDILAVEKLSAKGGDRIQFNAVLLTGGKEVKVGNPLIKDAGVQATVIDQIKDKKVVSFVKRRRKSSSKSKKGHRQQITLVKITEILETGADKTNVQEAKSGKGLKIEYATKVNTKQKTEKIVSKAKAGPNKEAPVKKEAKVQTETKPAKAVKTVTTKKKTETATEPTKAKKATRKKSS